MSGIIFLTMVWLVSAALVYIGMDISGTAYPLFGLIVPALVSIGILGKK